MNNFEIGTGIVAGLAIVGAIIWAIWEIQNLKAANLLVMEKLKDEKIQIRDHALSDDERHALLDKNLGSGNT